MTRRFDENWIEVGRTVDLSAITDQLDADTGGRAFDLFGAAKYKTETWSDGSETTYYDATSGAKVGSSHTYVNSYDQSTDTSYNDASGEFLGSYWSKGANSRWNSETVETVTFDFDGDPDTADTQLVVRVSRTEETRSWQGSDGQATTQSETREHYYSNDDNWNFLGGIDVRDGETTRWDSNWNELGRFVDLSAISTVLSSSNGRAFDLFGAAKYKSDSWSDGQGMSGSETTYYDATTGTKLGSSQSNVNTYQMGGTTVTSTNTNYNGPNGEYLGDEWSDGTNSRWNMESVKTLSEEPAWLDLDGNGTAGETKSVTVLVQEGASSRLGPYNQTET